MCALSHVIAPNKSQLVGYPTAQFAAAGATARKCVFSARFFLRLCQIYSFFLLGYGEVAMESRRKKYYKSYTNVDAENGSTANRRSTRQTSVNRKRKGENTPIQDNTQRVTKLRRANTAEYVATGLPMPGFLGNINTPQRVNTQQYSHLNPLNETHLPGICSSLLKLDPPVEVSLRSEDRGNSSALQQCLPSRAALQPVNQEDMQSSKAFPVLDVTLQA
ncbi:hypothetical protein O0L34_g19217 [Tuta absoluta]|nr:hypothetical protein O0L34_g19217 [Tuta absoluta]